MDEQDTTARKPGRPPGTGVVARLRSELLAEGKVTPLVDKVYALAMAGDLVAARLILDRVAPPLRAQAKRVKFELPAGGLTEQAKAVLQAWADGDLPGDQAAELITAIGRIVTVEQGDELRRMVEELKFGGIA